jgi:hypothetical protein
MEGVFPAGGDLGDHEGADPGPPPSLRDQDEAVLTYGRATCVHL